VSEQEADLPTDRPVSPITRLLSVSDQEADLPTDRAEAAVLSVSPISRLLSVAEAVLLPVAEELPCHGPEDAADPCLSPTTVDAGTNAGPL
jgi:hypothetical protein